MFVARSDQALGAHAARSSGASVTLGAFDGVHRGHQHLLSQALALRPGADGLVVACTFDPHPTSIVRPAQAPRLIDSLEGRLSRLAEHGLDGVFVQHFDQAAAQEEAEAFVERVLVRGLRARAVVVGDTFRFGRNRGGDVALLTRLGAKAGFSVHGAQAVLHDGKAISSTRVRCALGEGDLTLANTLLGRAYRVTGPVVHGDARGRTLGFPTANVAPAVECLLPRGVYAAHAMLEDGRRFAAAVSIGVHPTFTSAQANKIEAYLLDVRDIDVYGQRLHLDMAARLRGEERFASAESLVQQMHRDVDAVRALSLQPGPHNIH